MSERLHIQLLGSFSLTLDGERLKGFESLRLQRFLALLLLRDGVEHRSKLAFDLWPDSTEAQARTNLRKTLHELRQTLPDCEQFIDIGTERVGCRRNAPAAVDLLQFREAFSASDFGQAAAIYKGDLLPACYDDWVLDARASLRTDAQKAFSRLMEAAAERNEHEARLAHARRVLELEPTDEAAIRHQIEAHAALGDRNAAMRAYHRYAEALERELGVAPAEAVRALYRRVQSGYAQPTGTLDPAPEPTDEDPAAASPFVGREAELAALRAAWVAAREGAAHLLLVTGEPGIGKSRLARELGRCVQAEGHLLVTARAYEAAGRLPWGPVVDLLRSEATWERIDALEPAWRAELARLLPELVDDGQLSPHGQPGDLAQRHRLFDAVSRAIIAHDRPRLLIVDDLQWCDAETIEFIGFAIRSNPTAPVLIVGTVRPEDLSQGHPLTRLTDALEPDGVVTTLPLERLDMASTATLAARMRDVESIDPDFAARLWIETTGNPLFVVETLRAGISQDEPTAALSPTIRAILRARLRPLSEDARRLAEMAAVIGRAFSLDLLAAATGTDEYALVDAVDELWRRRIIREQGVRYDFSHDTLRTVALEMINPARRRLLHRAAAAALVAVHRRDPDAISPQVAAHYDQAGMVEPAIDAYRTAGGQAVAVSAFEEAVDHFQRALSLLAELPGSPARDRLELDLRMSLGSPLVALDGYGATRVHRLYERAMALCRKLRRPVDPPILRGLGLARLQGCRFAECSEFGGALVDKGAEAPVAVTEGRYLLGVSAFWQGDLARSRIFLESAIDNYDPAHAGQHLALYAQDPKAVCLVRLALVDLWQGDPGRAESTAREARRFAGEIGHLMTLGYVITYAAIGAAEAEDFGRLGELLGDGEELWKRFSMHYLSVVLQSLQGWTDLRAGSPEGLEKIANAVDRSRVEGETLHLTYTLLLQARAHERLGNMELARCAALEGLSLTRTQRQCYLEAEFHRLAGELALAHGEEDAALAAYHDAVTVARDQGARWLEMKARTSLARHFPDKRARADLKNLMSRMPSGHDLPAFRAAADALTPPA